MADSIEQLKGLISKRAGIARSNLFRVVLPSIETVTTSELNLLCKDVLLPGRLLMTRERNIGMRYEKLAYGYAVEDVVMTFHVTNDHAVRRYFETWQNKAINQDTYEVNFKKDYSYIVQIQPLKTTESLPVYTLANLNQAATFNPSDVAYTCTLYDAYPTQISTVQLNNDPDGIIELSVTFSYSNWRSF